VRLVNDLGVLLPEVGEIMELAVEKKVGIGFGHTDFQELLPLAKESQRDRRAGHPGSPFAGAEQTADG
jgi:hypothetical protein